VVPGVQNSLGDGPRMASCNSINSILKYKKIEKKVMQFVEERYRLRCANNTPRKRKRVVDDNEFTLKVDNFDDLLC